MSEKENKQKQKQKRKTVMYTVDPYQGVGALVMSMQLEGYRVVSFDRKGTKAKVIYEEIY